MGIFGAKKQQKRAQKYAIELLDLQTEKQKELNEHLGKQNWGYEQQSAQMNYDLGQMAADEQQRRNIEFYNLQQETEGLTAQFNEAQELGLNPLAFTGGGGASGGGGAGGSGQGGTAGRQQGQVGDYLSILNAATEAERAETERKLATAQIAQIGAETANTYADTRLKNEETKNTSAETERVSVEIKNTLQDIENKKVQKIGEELSNRINTVEASLREDTKGWDKANAYYEMERSWAEMHIIKEELDKISTENEISERTKELKIKEITQGLLLTQVEIQAKEKGIELTNAQIEQIKSEIESSQINDTIKKWEAENFKNNRLYETGEKILIKIIPSAGNYKVR